MIPSPQKQTRFAFIGGKPRAYNPSNKEIAVVQWQLKAHAPAEPMRGSLEVHYSFFLPIPKSTPKIQRKQMLSGLICHMKRPDVSNLAYLVENAMKGIIYNDDSQIRKFSAEKVYSDDPRIVVKVIELNKILFNDNID
jgi:Holliday junction resolvase RusA-like endonuclease